MNHVDLVSQLALRPRSLTRAIEVSGTIEPSGPLERPLSRLSLAAYRRRLRSVVAVATVGGAVGGLGGGGGGWGMGGRGRG